jgi:RNA polymerase sigma-70 factor (ECF subfamily)
MDDGAWQSALTAALRASSAIQVDARTFRQHAEQLRRLGGADPAHFDDLMLAFAAATGNDIARAHFDEKLRAETRSAWRNAGGQATEIDELEQKLRVRLLVPDAASPPRILGYRGTGPLGAWLYVAALRLALNLHRAKKSEKTVDLLGEVFSREPDPELLHMKTLYRAEFKDALASAISGLDDRDRAILRLHYADGLTLLRIAALYQVHESTVSRWVKGALSTIASRSQELLLERLALSKDSVESLARMVQSQLDLSIAGLLGE